MSEWVTPGLGHIKKIKRNAIQCLNCGDILESTHRHDFKTCSCGRVSVDGGHDYLRRCFESGVAAKDYKELSEYYEEDPLEEFID